MLVFYLSHTICNILPLVRFIELWQIYLHNLHVHKSREQRPPCQGQLPSYSDRRPLDKHDYTYYYITKCPWSERGTKFYTSLIAYADRSICNPSSFDFIVQLKRKPVARIMFLRHLPNWCSRGDWVYNYLTVNVWSMIQTKQKKWNSRTISIIFQQ